MGVLSLLVSVAMFISFRQSHFRLPITALVGYFVMRLLLVGAWRSLRLNYGSAQRNRPRE